MTYPVDDLARRIGEFLAWHGSPNWDAACSHDGIELLREAAAALRSARAEALEEAAKECFIPNETRVRTHNEIAAAIRALSIRSEQGRS